MRSKKAHRHTLVAMIRHNKNSTVVFKRCDSCGERKDRKRLVVFERVES